MASDLAELVDKFISEIVKAVRENKAESKNGNDELLPAEELAARLKVPVSWVYEQSRQQQIPTHHIGRYVRFVFDEVVKKRGYVLNGVHSLPAREAGC